jgi:T-complex protein 1 subunit alpha
MQYFVEANAIAVRRVPKEDMRHIAKATGATQVKSFNLPAFIIVLFSLH